MLVFRALLASCLSLCFAFHVGRFHVAFRKGSRVFFHQPNAGMQLRPTLAVIHGRKGGYHSWLGSISSEVIHGERILLTGGSHVEKWAAKKAEQLENAVNLGDVLDIYAEFLHETCNEPIDPIQLIVYQSTARRVAYHIVKFRVKGSSETDLMDSLTEVHMNAIERLLKPNTDPTDNSDERSNESDYERSSYQFAGLAHYMYGQVSLQLGSSPVISSDIRDITENVWMSPVLARLQRRCPGFVASEAEERIADMYSRGFETMINNLRLQLPKQIHLPAQSNNLPPCTLTSSATSTQDSLSTPTQLPAPPIPAWELACLVEHTLRSSLQQEEIPKLEQRVANAFRQTIAKRMHTHVKAIESLARSKDINISAEHLNAVEHYLNLAHESVAAVFTMWHIRHNLVGVRDGEGNYRKDYLQPIQLPFSGISNITMLNPAGQADATLRSVPPSLRYQVADDVEQLAQRLQPSALLTATALLAAAVRYSACEEFRALSTYTSAGDPDELTIDRDAVYFVVLAEVLAHTLTAATFDERAFYLNLLAFAALEETIGVREPRAACRRAFEIALRKVMLRLRRLVHATRTSNLPVDQPLSPEVMHFIADVRERLHVLSTGLGMILRLPEGEDTSIRLETFSEIVEELLKEDDERGRLNMRDVRREVPWMSLLLSIDPNVADNLILPVGQMKFDKLVGDLLLNADVAVSMPELGANFEKQILTVAESLLIPSEQAEARVVTLAGAVLSSLLQRCLDAHQKASFAHVDVMLTKAFYIYEHPLLKRFQGRNEQDLKEAGLIMAIAQVGDGGMMDLIRMVEGARARHSNNNNKSRASDAAAADHGWGSAESSTVPELPGLLEFIQSMQAFLLQEFTTGGYRQRSSSIRDDS